MKFIICATILPKEIEMKLPGASPAAGNFIRRMESAIKNKGYSIEECSFVALSGARELYEEYAYSQVGVVFKDKTIVKSVYDYQRMVLTKAHCGDVVLFYNIVYFDLGLVSKLKKMGVTPVLILADYTESAEEKHPIKRILSVLQRREFSKFDYGVILSEESKQFFNKCAKTVIMEGGVVLEDYSNIPYPEMTDNTRFLYAGTFSKVTGVDILLEAISKVNDPRLEFYFSGKGYLNDSIIEASQKDSRIKYLGFLDDKTYFDTLKKIHVFINPRNMTLPQNRNNFPSKVLEYLACGRPVISTKFPGYRMFEQNFIFCENDTNSLAEAIVRTSHLSDNDYHEYYSLNTEKAKNYSWEKQVEKVIDLIGLNS